MPSFYDLSQQIKDLEVNRLQTAANGDWALSPIEYLEIGLRAEPDADGYLPSEIKEKMKKVKKNA